LLGADTNVAETYVGRKYLVSNVFIIALHGDSNVLSTIYASALINVALAVFHAII
jgi:hypothetical protein